MGRSSCVVLTPPSIEPVGVEELKDFGKITHGRDDSVIETMIKAARELCEQYTERAFLQQEWTFSADQWAASGIVKLPKSPLVSVDEIRAIQDGGSTTLTIDSALYYAVLSTPGEVHFHDTPDFGTLRERLGIEIDFTCGYGAAKSDVPAAIRLGVLYTALHIYESGVFEMPEKARQQLSMSRVWYA